MFDKFHIFLGATVADAAARPLHWIYDQKTLQKHNIRRSQLEFFSLQSYF